MNRSVRPGWVAARRHWCRTGMMVWAAWTLSHGPCQAVESPTTGAASADVFGIDSLDALMEIRVDPPVQAASRRVQKSSEAPSAVSVVSREEIEQLGYRTLADVLAGQRGFYVTSDRSYSYVGVRGFGRPGDYNGRILLMVDGHRINGNVYDSGVFGTEFTLDMAVVDRVEIVRGPGSALYGNNAFFAVVNVITRPASQLQGGEATVAAGSWDTYSGAFTYGRRQGELDFLMSGSVYDSSGEHEVHFPDLDDPATNDGVAEDCDADRAYRAFARLQWRGWTLSGAYGWREKVPPTAPYGSVFDDPTASVMDERYYVDLRYERVVGQDWDLSGRAYYDVYHYEGLFPYRDDPGAAKYYNADLASGRWVGTEWFLSREIADRHRLLVGAEYRRNLDQEMENYDLDPRADYYSENFSGDVVGVYALAEVSLRTNLMLHAGIRYDYVTDFDDSWSPRAALIWNPASVTTLKLLYGEAFRAPNVYEAKFGGPGLGYLPNPNLEPEKIRTCEIVHEQQLPWGWRWTTSMYYYRIDGLISQEKTPSDLLVFENAEDTKAMGMEFGLEKRWPGGTLVRFSYAIQEAENVATDEVLSNCPRNVAQLQLQVPLFEERLIPALEMLYVGEVLDELREPVDEYFLVNLTISSRRVLQGLDLSASIYNLLDEEYFHPVGGGHVSPQVPQNGRGFLIKATYRF